MNNILLKDVIKISKGRKYQEVDTSEIRYIQIGDLRNDNQIKYCKKSDKMVFCDVNDVLIAWDGANAGTIGYGLKGAIGSTLAKLEPIDNSFYSPYLGKFLQSKFNYLRDRCTGATIPHISRPVLENLQIPLPSLQTQKRIAAILDDAQALKQKTEKLLSEYDALAQSIFLDLFGDPVTNPKGWEVKQMNEVCSKVTDGTHDTPERLKKGIKFITGKHIRPYRIDFENSDYVKQEVHEEIFRRCNPENGDVLYTNIGVNLGTAALNTVDYEFSMKNVALLKPVKNLLMGRYLEYFLNSSRMKEKILWLSSIGGAQKFLSLKELRKLKILIPNFKLQTEFVEKIAIIEQQKELAKQELKESEDLFNCLLQKAFKGELV